MPTREEIVTLLTLLESEELLHHEGMAYNILIEETENLLPDNRETRLLIELSYRLLQVKISSA